VLVAALERRLGVAQEVAKARTFQAASEVLAARGGGLPARIAAVRARLEAQAVPDVDAGPEAVEEAG
jgi:chorismate mutase